MKKKIQEVFGKAGIVIQTYQMVLVMSLLGAISMIFLISFSRTNTEEYFVFQKFALVSTLGISVMFALKMLAQRIGKELILEIIGLLFLVFFYFLLPNREKDFTEVYAFLILPTFLLSHLAVAFLAFLNKNRELNFWQYNKNLFLNISQTSIFTGVLTGGVLLAILAVDKLFDFNFNNNYYSFTFWGLAIFGSCFIFLLFNEKGLKSLESDGDYPVVLKFFTQYILIPLLIIYAVILYFYSAKILINWELPRGWVSYLILAYSVVGILALLLVHPLKEISTKSWVKVFSNIFYYTLAPLIILLFIAIFTRILEYGYTEPRYFVLILALWLTTVVLYFIFNPKQTIKFIPISLFTFGLFALACPYLNAFSVAKRSQKSELMQTLKDHHLLQSGQINFNSKIKSSVSNDIADKFEFLAKRNQQEFLMPLIEKELQNKITTSVEAGNFYSVENLIQNNFKNVTKDTPNFENNVARQNTLISKGFNADLKEYKYLFKAYNYKNNSFKFDNNTIEVDRAGTSQIVNELSITVNNQKLDLTKELAQLFRKYPTVGETEVKDLFIIKTIGNLELKIMFDEITIVKETETQFQYLMNTESVLILIKEN